MANRKKTTAQFVEESIEKWGTRWDYSSTIFSGMKSKVQINCPQHGQFTQLARKHLAGQVGCAECSGRGRSYEEFQRLSRERFGENTFDYLPTEGPYRARGKVRLRCNKHQKDFFQLAHNHLAGKNGCPDCHGKTLSLEQFLMQLTPTLRERWDYSETELAPLPQKTRFLCRDHGPFEQRYKDLLAGKTGCPSCLQVERTEALKRDIRRVWGDRWDLSEVQYVASKEALITLRCPTHGAFSQRKASILSEVLGCFGCGGVIKANSDELLRRAEENNVNGWDYSNTHFPPSLKASVKVTCPKHGPFTQEVDAHLRGKVGCISCQSRNTSKGEQELLDYVQSLGLEVHSRRRDLLPDNREVDIYVPSKKVALEYNGLYYHSSKFKDPKDHYLKYVQAQSEGIQLIQIWEDDWSLRKDIVQTHVAQVLGESRLLKIPARKTVIREISSAKAQPFLRKHHIQGEARGSVHLGAFYADRLRAVAVFKRRGQDYELIRYATSDNVQGGHSKLVAYFERNWTYQTLVTFADLTFGSGGLYRTTGWMEDRLLTPDYSYLVRGERKHKFGYRLKRFRQDPSLQYVEGMTEKELAALNGLFRIYDAGKIRFIKPHPLTGIS